MFFQPLVYQIHILLGWINPRVAKVRNMWKTIRDRKEKVASFGNFFMPTKVLPSELVDPAIENLFFRATGKIPFLVCQRDFWQLVIHGPIGSKPQGQFNHYCVLPAPLTGSILVSAFRMSAARILSVFVPLFNWLMRAFCSGV